MSATPPDAQGAPARRRRLPQIAVRPPFADVPGPFQRARANTSLEDQPTALQERGMRAFWWDGFWASVPETVLISYLGLYVIAFGGGNGQVGLVTAVGSLCAALAFFPGARFVETFGHRKLTVLVAGGGISRAALLALAAVPFVADGDTAIWLVMALIAVRGFFGFFAIPAWTSLSADIVPVGLRGRFFASRNFGMSLAALATAPAAGFLLDRFTGLDGWQLVWLLAAAAGALSTFAYARIPDASPHADIVPADQRVTWRGVVGSFTSDRNFVAYLVGTAIWTVALQASGPYFNIYLAENLDASGLWIGVLNALPAVTGLAGYVYFGRLLDLRGTKYVLVISGLLIPILPAAWIPVTAPWQVIFINAFGGVVWAGYQLALLNMVMLISPQALRPRYSAAWHFAVFAASFVGPLAGGAVIGLAGFRTVFALSAAGRLAGTLVMLRFVRAEPRPA